MSEMDSAQVQRVWQRVRGDQPENLQQQLTRLVRTAGKDAALYRRMSQKNSRWNRLLEEKQAQIGTLRGIYFIHAGTAMPAQQIPAAAAPDAKALRECAGRQLAALREYDRLAKTEEFGPIFAALRDDQAKHTHALLELIGRRAAG